MKYGTKSIYLGISGKAGSRVPKTQLESHCSMISLPPGAQA